MNAESYFPNYFAIDDLLVTQERIECKSNMNLFRMGFMDSGAETDDLQPERTVNLPLWYIKELKTNSPYFTIVIPDIYKNVHKAVCEIETTRIELGKLHPYFYEFGRYLTPYDRTQVVGNAVVTTLRHRVRTLFDIAKTSVEVSNNSQRRLESIENKLYQVGARTSRLYIDWLQMTSHHIKTSDTVLEHTKKRKRSKEVCADDNETLLAPKRPSV